VVSLSFTRVPDPSFSTHFHLSIPSISIASVCSYQSTVGLGGHHKVHLDYDHHFTEGCPVVIILGAWRHQGGIRPSLTAWLGMLGMDLGKKMLVSPSKYPAAPQYDEHSYQYKYPSFSHFSSVELPIELVLCLSGIAARGIFFTVCSFCIFQIDHHGFRQ
jgi:hypothetical protein